MNKYQPRSGLAFKHACFYLNLLLLLFSFCWTTQPLAATGAIRAGFATDTLLANDDGSTAAVPLGFDINFFGNPFSSAFVNNNGNITFDSALSNYTPEGFAGAARSIIAPFFADVDTTVTGSNPVTYGTGMVGSRPAFGVNWINVGCYSTPDGGFNSFQMVLVDRSDIGAGDFDIEFNYDTIVWETGTASGGSAVCQGGTSAYVGYSNGTTTSFELFGSGVNGAFLDSNLDTGLIHNSRDSLLPGRYVFAVRNGIAPVGHSISGTIFGDSIAVPLADAPVQICTIPTPTIPDIHCNLTRTNAAGAYLIDGLADGSYSIRAFPPAATNYQTGTLGPVDLAGLDLNSQDITLKSPQPLPANTSVSPSFYTTETGEPVVYWGNDLTFSTQGCTGGTASYKLTDSLGVVVATGAMPESGTSPGNYSGTAAALYPQHGQFLVTLTVNCPDGSSNVIEFNMYVDPSGTVKNQFGQAVSNATVTLYRSDSSAGPFTIVPNGSEIMSPTNRVNPFQTGAQGLFGWDVVTGFYVVRAEAAGCTSPANASQAYVETAVMSVPPEVTGLQLVLDCPIPVPNVVNQTQASAEAAITAAHLAVGTISTQTSDTVQAGSVISQTPTAGTSVAAGTPVDLVVSSGPALVVVPNVLGQDQATAQTALTGANLAVGNVTTASSDTVPVGSVISQTPAAGTSVAKRTAVDLVISSGPALVAVPNVVGQTQAAALAALTAVNLNGTVTTASSSTVAVGLVISQNPASGSVPKNTAIALVVSSGPVVVGDTPYAQFTSSVKVVSREMETSGRLLLGTTSNGINPLTEVVTLKIGNLVKTIPAGTLRYSATTKTYSYTGTIGGNKMVIKITQTAAKTFTYSISISSINPASFPKGSRVDVSLTIGNDTGTAPQVLIQ